MRKIFTIVALLSLASCLSESSSTPGKANSFIRYYSGGNDDTAQALEITPDNGFIILATTRIQKTEADKAAFKVKLIKTDENGNIAWQALFPSIADGTSQNYTASSLQIMADGGYVITGQDIQADGSTKMLLLTVGSDGSLIKKISFNTRGSGKAVAINKDNNFLVLGTSGTDSMKLSEIRKTDYSIAWTKTYAAGSTTLANRLFVEQLAATSTLPQKVLWSGFVTKSGLTGIRMIKANQNAENTDFDLLISIPGFSETATDFCRFGADGAYTYAITGSTNQKAGSNSPGGDTDILFKRFSSDGTVLSTKSFPFKVDNQNDTGNSISATTDGGVILLSSVNSPALESKGRGDTDYFLIRINAFGDEIWTNSFGSRFKDEGVAVRQTPDGGYAVLGTTTQGALKIVSLLKTDASGQIQ